VTEQEPGLGTTNRYMKLHDLGDDMRRLRHLLAGLALVAGMIAVSVPASAGDGCYENSCHCPTVVVLGRTILHIDC